MHIARTTLAAVAAVAVLGASHPEARQQPRGKTFPSIPITGSSERINLMRTQLDLADSRISDYVLRSILSMQQGHQQAMTNFAIWYRNYEHAKETAATGVAQEIFKQLLPVTFKIIFPESEKLIEACTKVTEGIVSVGEKALDVPSGDIDLFLTKLQAAEEKEIAALLDAPKVFRQQNPDVFETAKWEYFEARLQDPATQQPGEAAKRAADLANDPSKADVPESVQKLLETVGVPRPGAATAARVAEGVLASHIYNISNYDPEWMWPYSRWQYARAHALHQLDPAGNKARVCDQQQSWRAFWVVPPKECAALRGQ